MLRNRQTGGLSLLNQNNVTASLPVLFLTGLLEGLNGLLPGYNRESCHQTATSTSRTEIVSGMLFAARASRHAAIASRMFSTASASVRPCETHPGIAGHSATIIPVSSDSRVTRSFMLPSVNDAIQPSTDCLSSRQHTNPHFTTWHMKTWVRASSPACRSCRPVGSHLTRPRADYCSRRE
jgi:hypothetical protein